MKINYEGFATHIYKNVSVNDVLKEAIMNSVHANATEINIDLLYQNSNTLFGDGDLGNLLSISILDNGDGFTEENELSFLELYTKHKSNIGGKGIGRVSYLNLAKKVKLESVSKEKKHIEFNFTYDLDEAKIIRKDNSTEKSFTRITLNELSLKYPKTQATSCYNFIKEKFNLFLFLKQKDSNKTISIKLHVNGSLCNEVKSNDIKCLDELTYTSGKVEFIIYTFKNIFDKGIKLFYCANQIQVKPIDIAEKFHTQYVFAITSEFFDINANEERTKINLPDDNSQQSEMFGSQPEKDYEEQLKKECLKIINKYEPNIKEENQAKIDQIAKDYGYINLKNIDLEDYNLDEKDIIEKYRNKLNKKEDKLVNLLNKPDVSLEELVQEVSEQNKHELAKYIFHRDFILKKIESLIENKSSLEKDFHDLLFGEYSNNIWSIDDKFMSYTEAFSDEKISTIKKQIYDNYKKTNGDLKEPDITLLYSNETKDGYKDAVVCELKAFDISSDRKLVSITELNRNLGYIVKGIDNINNVWGYIITTLDEATQEELSVQQGVSKIFTNGMTPIYYYNNGNIEDINKRKVPCHVYIISPESLVKDARERNKTFLDILKS
jgi:hypothetical protein